MSESTATQPNKVVTYSFEYDSIRDIISLSDGLVDLLGAEKTEGPTNEVFGNHVDQEHLEVLSTLLNEEMGQVEINVYDRFRQPWWFLVGQIPTHKEKSVLYHLVDITQYVLSGLITEALSDRYLFPESQQPGTTPVSVLLADAKEILNVDSWAVFEATDGRVLVEGDTDIQIDNIPYHCGFVTLKIK